MEKRTEDFIKATEKFISCFKPEKLEAARGWAGMYLVLAFWQRNMRMAIMVGVTSFLAIVQKL